MAGDDDVMKLTIQLPTETMYGGPVAKLSAHASDGAFGVLTHHIDYVAALAPGILSATRPDGTTLYFAVDEGVFVKRGLEVRVCVRRAVQGDDFSLLSRTVRETFLEVDDRERRARAALARLEADVVRRFIELRDNRR